MRKTYAVTDDYTFRLRAVAELLGVSENTLRSNLAQSAEVIEVKRQSQENSAAPAIRIFDLETIFKLARWRRQAGLSKIPKAKKPVVISVEIIKGGTAKSTTAAEVGTQLQLMGYNVLMIDVDVQTNLTQLMGYEADLEDSDAETYQVAPEAIVNGTWMDVYTLATTQRCDFDPKTIIKRPFGEAGPALIPADPMFSDLDQHLAYSKGSRELAFRRIITAATQGDVPGFDMSEFDVVIFDCPPSVSFVTSNALAASDIVIAPVKMESFAVKGLSQLFKELNTLRREYPEVNPRVTILPTHFSNSLLLTTRMQQRLVSHRELLSTVSISKSQELPKSNDAYLPLTLQKPSHPVVKEYRQFSEELAKMVNEIAKEGM